MNGKSKQRLPVFFMPPATFREYSAALYSLKGYGLENPYLPSGVHHKKSPVTRSNSRAEGKL